MIQYDPQYLGMTGFSLPNRTPLVSLPKRYGSHTTALRFENQRAVVPPIDKEGIAITQHYNIILT